MSYCCNSKSNCIYCNKTRIKASWDNCLDNSLKDISGIELCKKPVLIPSNSTIQPNPSHQSNKFKLAQIVKKPGNTVYGRWSKAKYNSKTRKYTILRSTKRTTY